MKILQVGNPEKVAKIKEKRIVDNGTICPYCDAKFLIDPADHKLYNYGYGVLCPCCESFISTNIPVNPDKAEWIPITFQATPGVIIERPIWDLGYKTILEYKTAVFGDSK